MRLVLLVFSVLMMLPHPVLAQHSRSCTGSVETCRFIESLPADVQDFLWRIEACLRVKTAKMEKKLPDPNDEGANCDDLQATQEGLKRKHGENDRLRAVIVTGFGMYKGRMSALEKNGRE